MRISSTTILLLLAAGSVGCSRTASLSAISRHQTTAVAEPVRFGSASETLTAAELLTAQVTSTADGVRRLRPEFLRAVFLPTPNAGIVPTYPSVYLNGVYAGALDVLETIPLGVVDEIRFVRTAQAKDWWGSYCPCGAGVIAVRTRKDY